MYGTVAKLLVKPGSEPLLEVWMVSRSTVFMDT